MLQRHLCQVPRRPDYGHRQLHLKQWDPGTLDSWVVDRGRERHRGKLGRTIVVVADALSFGRGLGLSALRPSVSAVAAAALALAAAALALAAAALAAAALVAGRGAAASLPSAPPAPPPSSPLAHTFANMTSLKTAVQEFNSNMASATMKYGPISNWVVSSITNMSGLFQGLEGFNEDISSWNTSAVTDMSSMFEVRSSRAPASTLASNLLSTDSAGRVCVRPAAEL